MIFYDDPIRLTVESLNTYTAVDLTVADATVSANATAAILRVINVHASTSYGFLYRHPLNNAAVTTDTNDHIYFNTQQDFVVPVSSKTVSIAIEDQSIEVYLVGYFVAGEAASLIQKYTINRPAASWVAGWQTQTLPESTIPRDAQFVFGELQYYSTTTNYTHGFRQTGSTDNKYGGTHHSSFIVPVNNAGQFDFYAGTASSLATIKISGYITVGSPVTNGTDISLTAYAAWTTGTAATASKAMLVLHHVGTSRVLKAGWRKLGSGVSKYYAINQEAFGFIPLDTANKYELMAESSATDCFVYGYFNLSVVANESLTFADDVAGGLIPVDPGTGTHEIYFDGMDEALSLDDASSVTQEPASSDGFSLGFAVDASVTFAYTSGEWELPIPEMDMVGLWGGATDIVLEVQEMIPEMSMTGVTGEVGNIVGDLPIPEFGDDFDGVTGQVGTIDLTFPDEWIELAMTGMTDQITGTIALTWPLPTMEMTGITSLLAPAAVTSVLYAMNTKVLGVTEYASLGITSLCVCNGKMYGIGKDGIYEFSGQNENGFPIKTLIEKRGMDFGTPMEKRITDAYAYIQSSGPYSVRVASSGKKGTVICPQSIGELHGSKIDLPRGIEGRVFDWTFYTTEQNEFELVEQELMLNVATKRHGRQNR